ncbi:MAG: cell division ATP-binding protein FtsE [Caldimicrobium sp.]|jgi:cell division transport system ATP-binding protein
MSLILFEGVTKIYPPYYKALHRINLEIKKGEFLLLTGPTGAGKTTLLKLIYAEEKPTEGEIYFEGVPYSTLSYKEIISLRQEVGIVFQDHKLFLDLTIYENLEVALALSGKRVKKRKFYIYEWLERFGLSHKAKKLIKELSGGEQQKVGLIRALIKDPAILILDEPTGNLDPFSIGDIIELLKNLHKEGKTIILSTHDPTIISKKPGRIIMLDRGELVTHVDIYW